MNEDTDRQTGRTTRQMQQCPKSAVFVWCDRNLRYPFRLARSIGREDLEIVSSLSLDEFNHEFQGRRFSGIELDHAARLTYRQYCIYRQIRDRQVIKQEPADKT